MSPAVSLSSLPLLVLDEVNYYLKNASVKSKMTENKDNKRSIAVAIMFMESEREA